MLPLPIVIVPKASVEYELIVRDELTVIVAVLDVPLPPSTPSTVGEPEVPLSVPHDA